MNVKGLIRQFSGGRGRRTGTTPTSGTGRRGSAGGGDEVVRGVKKLLRSRRR